MRKAFAGLLSAVLLVLLLVPALPLDARAASTEAGEVKLKENDSPELRPFKVENMFPGDSVTKEYIVSPNHKYPITLYFSIDLTLNEGNLAEQLQATVTADGEEIYSGPMTGCISQELDLPADKKSVEYDITVFLPTSVGNEYMNKTVEADFRWWFMDGTTENPTAVTIQPVAEVLLDNKYPRGEDFQFQLKDEHTGQTYPVRNNDGAIVFPSITYPGPGTYKYTITQIPGTNPDINYDTSVFEATVVITPNPNAPESYEVTITYTRNGQPWGPEKGIPRFANTTKQKPIPSDPSTIVPENPKTGDTFPLKLLSMAMIASGVLLVCLFVLWKDRKDREDAK